MTVLLIQAVVQLGALALVTFLAYRLGRYMERYDAIHAAVDVANKITQVVNDLREHLVVIDSEWLRQGRGTPPPTSNPRGSPTDDKP